MCKFENELINKKLLKKTFSNYIIFKLKKLILCTHNSILRATSKES